MPAKKRAVSQSARDSTGAKRARNASLSAQNSTPTLPVPPPQSLIHDAEEVPHSRQLVQDHRKAQRKQPSLSLLWISPSSDPPLPLQCCKTYTLLVSSPSPPLRIQM